MKQILVYSDSLSWGIIPMTRERLAFEHRWPGVLEMELHAQGQQVRVIEDCLNGRRTVLEDPLKPGRNGLAGLAQRVEICSPLAMVILLLGTNDFQSMHAHTARDAAQGMAALVASIRNAPIEPGMPVPKVLVVAPPPISTPNGAMAPKFAGAGAKSIGLAQAYAQMCEQVDCSFFDAASVVAVSALDGVHIDAPEHLTLGLAISAVVAKLIAPDSF